MLVSIELLRGIAALMVITVHYSYLFPSTQNTLLFLRSGVDLFFVISGFIFANTIISKGITVKELFIRRFFRLYPLYLISLVLYYFFSQDFTSSKAFFYFVRHLFFLQTTHSLEESTFFNIAYWSLPVEIEFYMLVPILSLFTYNLTVLLHIMLITILLRTLLVLGATDFLTPNIYTILQFHLPGIISEFLIGIITYYIYINFYKSIKIKSTLVFIFSVIFYIIVFSITTIICTENNSIFVKMYFGILWSLCYAIILLYFLLVLEDKLRRYFSSLCIFLGQISYGSYLFHNLIPIVLDRLGCHIDSNGLYKYIVYIFLVIIFSYITFHVIEKPLNTFGRSLLKNSQFDKK